MSRDRDPRLIWTEAGEPRSDRFGDVYFSAEDGLSESRAVFLSGCGLPEAWLDRRHFCVAELGFGTGLNIAALLHLWRETRPVDGHLSIFSVEAFPLTVEEARRALSRFPEVASAASALLAAWPEPTPGFHRMDLPGFNATLDLAVGEAHAMLGAWSGPVDAWFLDGFAPATNPAMWSEAVCERIADRSAPGARLATFTVAGVVRRGLASRGFVVEKKRGHGKKRERLEGVFPGRGVEHSLPTVAVIGAGIAGASVARALTLAGLEPRLFEAHGKGSGASGFPAALVTPRFDIGDAAIAALFAQALERARSLYAAVPNAVIAEGVLQMPGGPRDPMRFRKLACQPIWPKGALTPTEAGDLMMHQALTVSPADILKAWAPGEPTLRQVASLSREVDGWTLRDPAGHALDSVALVVVCAGAGTTRLLPALDLAPVRGQAEWTMEGEAVATAWGGYVAPMHKGFLFGATHDRGDTGTDIRPGDAARNVATLSERLPQKAKALSAALKSRAAIRATTRDRLPICGPVPDAPGLFVLSGLGSRGFCLAPLLGEHLAATMLGRPSPLPGDIASRLDPGRPSARRRVEPGSAAHG